MNARTIRSETAEKSVCQGVIKNRHLSPQVRRFAAYTKVILVLALPLLLGAREDKWVRLAEHDLVFARGLAADKSKFGPEFARRVIEGRVAGCHPRASKLTGLTVAGVRQLDLYCDHHCLPLNNTWSDVLRPCDGDRFVPSWCKSGNAGLAAAHLRLGPYFETLTTALRATETQLAAYNIMAVIADRLDTNVIRDYDREEIEKWVNAATSAFLEHADPDQAIDIGWLLYSTPLENSPTLAKSFRTYRLRTPKLTVEQQDLLESLAHGIEEGTLSNKTRRVLQARVGPTDSSARTLPAAPRTKAAEIALLMRRIETYYCLMRDGKYAESWKMVATEYRETGHDSNSYIRNKKVIEDGSKLLGWRAREIRVSGDIANVLMEIRRERRGLFQSKQESLTDTDLWIFENGSWYNMVRWPTEWDDRDSVSVTIPTIDHSCL